MQKKLGSKRVKTATLNQWYQTSIPDLLNIKLTPPSSQIRQNVKLKRVLNFHKNDNVRNIAKHPPYTIQRLFDKEKHNSCETHLNNVS